MKGISLNEKIGVTSNWSIEYEGHHILELCANKPKMTYKEIMFILNAEGGYVDSNGIIHKGTAENKVYTLD